MRTTNFRFSLRTINIDRANSKTSRKTMVFKNSFDIFIVIE